MASDYSGPARLFQQMALGSKVVAELTFDIEKAVFGKRAAALECGPPIFISGMARAGTTALLRALNAQPMFATLTFRDLPFLLAPNLWNRIGRRSRRDAPAQARGQDDGILQGLDSPEALEEAFWRVFDGSFYIEKRSLRAYSPRLATLDDYRTYVRLILLRYGGSRYLAKNNNNVLRLPGLLHAFPDAIIVHPFRDPVQHIGSLMHHFAHAVETQGKDPFKLSYMSHLAHYEFGLDHRPFTFPGKLPRGNGAKDPNYWLGHWIDLHSFIIDQPEEVCRHQHFVDMDKLASSSEVADNFICDLVGVKPRPYPSFRSAVNRVVEGFEPSALRQANSLAAEMRRRVECRK